MAAADVALDKANTFMCQHLEQEREQQAMKEEIGTQTEDTHPTNTSLAGTRLDNNLRPTDRLSRTMSLEEATK